MLFMKKHLTLLLSLRAFTLSLFLFVFYFWVYTWVYFRVYPVFNWGGIVTKVLAKVRGLGKNIKREGWSYRGIVHNDIERLIGGTLDPWSTGATQIGEGNSDFSSYHVIHRQSNNWNIKLSIIYLKCCCSCLYCCHFLNRWISISSRSYSRCYWYFW